MEQSNQSDHVPASTDHVAPSNQEPIKNPEGVFAKNKELLGTNKNLRSELDTLKEQVTSYQDAQSIAEGDKDKVITGLRERLSTSEGALKDTKSSYAYERITQSLRDAAIKQGCVNSDAFIKLLGKDDYNSLEVGENFKLNSDDVTSLVENSKKNYDFLFKKVVAPTSDLTPGGKPRVQSKGTNKMSSSELQEFIINKFQ